MTISINLKVSLIVPVRNEAHRILPLLEAFNQQSNKNFEVIFVDDNSTDDTISVINTHLIPSVKRQVMSNQRQIGINRSANRGLQIAKNELVAFLSGHDPVCKNLVQRVIRAFSDCGHAKMCIFDSFTVTNGYGDNRIEHKIPINDNETFIQPQTYVNLMRFAPFNMASNAIFYHKSILGNDPLKHDHGLYADWFLKNKSIISYGAFYSQVAVTGVLLHKNRYEKSKVHSLIRRYRYVSSIYEDLLNDKAVTASFKSAGIFPETNLLILMLIFVRMRHYQLISIRTVINTLYRFVWHRVGFANLSVDAKQKIKMFLTNQSKKRKFYSH